jgi:hypothetical protein
MDTNDQVCSICEKPENKDDGNSELRPYGPNGSNVCAGCFMGGSSELKAVIHKNMTEAVDKAYDQADENGGGMVVFGDGPPQFVSLEQAKEN